MRPKPFGDIVAGAYWTASCRVKAWRKVTTIWLVIRLLVIRPWARLPSGIAGYDIVVMGPRLIRAKGHLSIWSETLIRFFKREKEIAMFGSTILDVAVGMIFVYLLIALIVSSLSELIAAALKWRAKNLAEGIHKLLGAAIGDATTSQLKSLKDQLYEHPLIKCLYKGTHGPSYIPSHTFALVLLDLVSKADPAHPRTVETLQSAFKALPADLSKTLNVLLAEAGSDIKTFEEGIETWFNNSMDRVSGWYKRKSQVINVVLAVVVTALANADSILIAKSLSSDPALRASLVAEAEKFGEQNAQQSFSTQVPPADSPAAKMGVSEAQKTLESYRSQIAKLGVPLGWKAADPKHPAGPNEPADPRSFPEGFWPGVMKILGLLLTAVAASLGAPFWFDMLNKVINIRSSGKAPEEKQKSPKKTPTPPEVGETAKQAAEREQPHGD